MDICFDINDSNAHITVHETTAIRAQHHDDNGLFVCFVLVFIYFFGFLNGDKNCLSNAIYTE